MLESKCGIQIGKMARGIIIALATTIALCAPALAFADEPDDSFDSDFGPSATTAQTDDATANEADGVTEESSDVAGDGIDDSASENDANVEPVDPNGAGSDPDSPGIADDEGAEGDFPQSDEPAAPSDDDGDQHADDVADAVVDAECSFDGACTIDGFAVKSLECDTPSNDAETVEAPASTADAFTAPDADDTATVEAPRQVRDETVLSEPDETEAPDSKAESDEPDAPADGLSTCTNDAVQPIAATPVIQANESADEADCESTGSEPEPPIQPDLPMPFEPNGPVVPPTSLSSQMRSIDNAEQPDSLFAAGETGPPDFRLSATKAFTGKAPRSSAPCLGQHRCRSPNAPYAL